jgi:hypothetical protein
MPFNTHAADPMPYLCLRQLIHQQLLLFSHWLLIVEQPAQSVI